MRPTSIPLGPSDLEMLCRVVAAECERRGMRPDAPEAEDIAARALGAFFGGHFEESELQDLLQAA